MTDKVYGAIDYCINRGHTEEHEIVFLTDGMNVVAYGPEVDCIGTVRQGSRYFVVCGQPVGPEGRACEGEVTFNTQQQPEAGAGWHDNPEWMQLLAECGYFPDEMN